MLMSMGKSLTLIMSMQNILIHIPVVINPNLFFKTKVFDHLFFLFNNNRICILLLHICIYLVTYTYIHIYDFLLQLRKAHYVYYALNISCLIIIVEFVPCPFSDIWAIYYHTQN